MDTMRKTKTCSWSGVLSCFRQNMIVQIIIFCFLFIYNFPNFTVASGVKISKDGIELSYNVTSSENCQTNVNKVNSFVGISLSDCVIECGLRNHCLALSYHHEMTSCLLLGSTDKHDIQNTKCDYILRGDITVNKIPCGNECSDGLTCGISSKQCEPRECGIPNPINGTFHGNSMSFGSKVRYKCEYCKEDEKATYSAVCLDNGQWSYVANCTDLSDWVVIQRRMNASGNFYRTWDEYKAGFGDLDGNFWLGNEKIRSLTKHGTWKLRVELSLNNEHGFAEYSSFVIGDASSNYVLHIGDYSGNIGDSLIRHNGSPFSTHDRDNDMHGGNCAKSFFGGWWYKDCHDSNLNGQYGNNNFGEGLNWKTWKTHKVSLTTTEMKILQCY